MKTDINEIFARMDLRQIRNFAFDEGLDPVELTDNRTYSEQLKDGNKLLLKRLADIYKDDPHGHSDAMIELNGAVRAHRDVFLEIGMKVGARLLFQLLFQDK